MTKEERQTISKWLIDSIEQLKDAGIESARLDCLLVLEKVLNKPREWILAHPEYEISGVLLEDLSTKISQRIERTPLAYIIGSKEFYGREFFVNEAVLIPRPESEAIISLLRELVSRESLMVNRRKSLGSATAPDKPKERTTTNEPRPTIIDIGTGSGCLAITAKLLYPDVHVTAIDTSSAALRVAAKNARLHDVHIQFKELDIYDGLPAMPKTRPYTILANLPYVPDTMITSKEITKEPAVALFSGKDGLDHYRELWKQVSKLKNKPSQIITESLESQHLPLEKLALRAGYQLGDTQTLAQLFTKQ